MTASHYWWRPPELRTERGRTARARREAAEFWDLIVVPAVRAIFDSSGVPLFRPGAHVAPITGDAIAFWAGEGSAPFLFTRESYLIPDLDDELGRQRQSCASIGQPHDAVVMAVLSLLKNLDRRIYIRSDANVGEWERGVALANLASSAILVTHPFTLQVKESPEYVLDAPGRFDRVMAVPA